MSDVGYDTDAEDAVHMSSGSEDFDEPMQAEGRVRATEIGFDGKTIYEIDLDGPAQGASRSIWQRGNARGMIGSKAEFDRTQKARRDKIARSSSSITRLEETVDPVMGRTSLQSQAYVEKLARYRPTRAVNAIDRGEGPSRPGPSRKRPRTVRTPSSSPPPTSPPPIRVRKEINPRLLGRQSVPRTANHVPVAPTFARAFNAPQPRTALAERTIIDLADSSSEIEILDSGDEIQILNPRTVATASSVPLRAQAMVAGSDNILNGHLKRSPSPDFAMQDSPPTPQSANVSNIHDAQEADIPMASDASRPPSRLATVVPSPTNEIDINDDDDDPTLVESNIFDNADEEKPKVFPTFRFVQQREPTIFVLDSDDEKPPRPKHTATASGDVSDFDEIEEEFEINALNRQWNESARASGAASITIDARGVKHARFPLPTGFVYLENRYERPGNLPPADDSIPQCSCPRRCDPQQCACQLERSNPRSPFAILSKNNRRAFAYNADGTLKAYAIAKYLMQNQCVYECSRSCDCYNQERGCINTVAQRRRFPLTIYHTGGRGWGVKTDSRIGKNSAIGVMTGELIKRSVPVASKEYLINLEWDYDEHGPAVPEDEKYMVDCFKYGNWARFINHSCDPNLATYNVMFDCPPKTSPPYAGFYALRDIGEGEELTFDYNGGMDPNEIEDQTRLDDAMPCLCGAANCRKRIT